MNDAMTQPVVIAAVIATALTAFGAAWNYRRNLRVAHKQTQREALRSLISKYHGRMLEAAIDWDRRMGQLYESEDWLMHTKDTRDLENSYYYHSFVFRFWSLLAIARQFEREAFYIDSRIARERELDFLRYTKSFLWCMTAAKITPHDGMPGRDHFRNDAFRPVLDLCYEQLEGIPESTSRQGDIIFDYHRFRALVQRSSLDYQTGADQDHARGISELLNFFANLKRDEPATWEGAGGDGRPPIRRRWDRLVLLHLLVLGFIGTFGYEWQRSVQQKRKAAIRQLHVDRVATNAFVADVDQLGLSDQVEMLKLVALLERYPQSRNGTDSPASRDYSMDAAVGMTDEEWMARYEADLGADEYVFSMDETHFANHKWIVWSRSVKLRLAQIRQAVPMLQRW